MMTRTNAHIAFDSMPFTCQQDTWGIPNSKYKRPPYRTDYEKRILGPCALQFSTKSSAASAVLRTATAIYSKDSSSYDDFESIDLIPENRDLYMPRSPWGNKFDFQTAPEKSIMASFCSIEDSDEGSHWEVTRLGPFTTTGGYDWLQVGWDDIFGLGKVLEGHPEGVFLVEQFMSPVFENGSMISYPPIHIHHMHIGPVPVGGSYVRQRRSPFDCAVFGSARSCFYPDRVMETHGDYTCSDEDGGLDCRLESFPDGHGKLITSPLGIEGELNDVRAAGSEPLTWYWQVGVRWALSSSSSFGGLKAASLHNMAGPGTFSPTVQKSLLFTFPTPTAYDGVFWYTGRMQNAGELLRLKIHGHNTLFAEALFFAASPQDLGLIEANGFHLDRPYEPEHRNHTETKKMISHWLRDSQKRFDSYKEDHIVYKNSCGYPHPSCVASRPRLVCQFKGSFQVIDGIAYDRREPTCCENWIFSSGQSFTAVGFTKHMGYPQGLNNPDIKNIPSTLPGHVGFWVSFAASQDDTETSKETSYYGYSLYNHYEDGGLSSVKDMATYQKFAMFFNFCTSPHWNNYKYVPNSTLALALSAIVNNVFAIAACFLLVLFYFIVHRCNRSSPFHMRKRHSKQCDLSQEVSSPSSSKNHFRIVRETQHDDDETKVPFLEADGIGSHDENQDPSKAL